MTDTAESSVVRVPPRTVAPAELTSALRELWHSACDAGGDVARAMTMNFIAVADAADEADLRAAADRLMRRSPARAFLVVIDEATSEPTAEVAAVTRCHGRSRDVMLEEIVVRAPRRWFAHVPGLIRPLLLNDLPTHLFWVGDWQDDADIKALRELGDRCVIDSRRFSLPAVQLPAAAGHATDLTWLRLRPWRRALAEAFELVAYDAEVELTGVVRHGRDGTAAAILLAEWLEARLGGRIALEESASFGESCPESAVLRFAGTEIETTSDDKCLTVSVSTPAQCFLPFRLPRSSGADGDLLAAAIDIA